MSGRSGKNNQFSNEVSRQVKRYNEKVKRITKKYPELRRLYPETLKVRDMRKVILTEKDLSKLTEAVNKLFIEENIKPIQTNEKVILNKWAMEEYEKDREIVNKMKLKELSILMNTSYKGSGFSYVQMSGTVGNDLKLIQKTPEEYERTADFARMLKSVKFRAYPSYLTYRNTVYKKHFIESLKPLGKTYYNDKGFRDTIDLAELIKDINPDEFVDFLKDNGEELHLLLNENYTDAQKEQRLTELVGMIKKLLPKTEEEEEEEEEREQE